MTISVFEMFKIGIGPSSSHTVGPMRAARQFLLDARDAGHLDHIARLNVKLFGSLALTGRGHGTDRAILLGLAGEEPDSVDPDLIGPMLDDIRGKGTVSLLGNTVIPFDAELDLEFRVKERLPRHTNGMRFRAMDAQGQELLTEEFYSIGGGFVLRGDEPDGDASREVSVPYPFESATQLLRQAAHSELRIPDLMLANERAFRSEEETRTGLEKIWGTMQDCVKRGIGGNGDLPGGLHVKRRAPDLYRQLMNEHPVNPLDVMDWVNLFALAVNEENAAGGRVVTAPTNGAAGIIPAVLHYYWRFVDGSNKSGVTDFLLTAGAIGILYKKNASISGAEMGCQGEVGVACSMAAGGLAAAMGARNEQIENAAEIAMEHNLGLTCDPVRGLVQIPCIERNAMAAVKAVNAQRLALHGDGRHRVSLDEVIATMRATGRDMQTIYKETSLGGLAVNVIEC